MKRTAFSSTPFAPRPARQWEADELPGPRVPLQTVTQAPRPIVTIVKDRPVRDEAYRRLVASLPCAHCKRPGPSQCAHADEGKGFSIKASDLETYPLCADAPGRRGCHSLIGASGMFTRDQRRALESAYVAQTRARLGQGPNA